MRPGEEIRLVKENLAFAVALWKGAASGKVPAAPLVRSGSEVPLFNQQRGAPSATEGELAAELTRGAANQMRAAFALSALQAQQSLFTAFSGEPIEEEWVELRAARSAMYLIGRAVRRSILQPVWECPPPYRRQFHIRRIGFTLNATGLEGRVLSWDDFGGLERYLSLLEYCASSANAAAAAGNSRTLPSHPMSNRAGFGGVLGAPDTLTGGDESSPPVTPPKDYPGDRAERRLAPDAPPFLPPRMPEERDAWEDSWDSALAERAGKWHAQPAGAQLETPANGTNGHKDNQNGSPLNPPAGNLVGRFIAERCQTGDGQRMLAGELYAGFLGWCQEFGHRPVSQRAFGLRLTGLGLRRKRRGHGKHWWEGIQLAAPAQHAA